MYSCGILIEQHLQCTQFCALITSFFDPSAVSWYSYTCQAKHNNQANLRSYKQCHLGRTEALLGSIKLLQ